MPPISVATRWGRGARPGDDETWRSYRHQREKEDELSRRNGCRIRLPLYQRCREELVDVDLAATMRIDPRSAGLATPDEQRRQRQHNRKPE